MLLLKRQALRSYEHGPRVCVHEQVYAHTLWAVAAAHFNTLWSHASYATSQSAYSLGLSYVLCLVAALW